jgi:hypothetical protein
MDETWPQHQNYVDEQDMVFFSSVGQLLETGKNLHRLSGRFLLGFFLTVVFKRIFKNRL